MCTLILILTTLFFSRSFAIDIAAPVAEGLQTLVGEDCPSYDEENAKAALKGVCDTGTSKTSSADKNTSDISKLKNAMQISAEDQYFQALAIQHSTELVCGAHYAGLVAKGDKDNSLELEKAFEDLRQTKQATLDASEALKKNPGTQVCPPSQTDLDNDIPKNQRALNKDYALCSDVIASREAYNRALAKIPLSGAPSIQKLMNQYQVKKSSLSTADFQKELQQAYAGAKKEMTDQAQELLKRAQGQSGAPDFNRNEKRALISNPLITEKVLKSSGNTNDMKALVCSADARYGKGADRLDTALFMGSLVGTGTVAVIAKVGSKAMSLMRVAGTGTRFGSVPLALQVGAYSANIASGASEIYKSCARQSQSLQVTQSSNQCVSAPSIEQLKQDSCVFSAGMSSLTVGTTAMSTRLATIAARSKATVEAQRTAQVNKILEEKKIQNAREQKIAENKAQGVETLKWKGATSPEAMPSQSGSTMTTDKKGLRFDQRRSLKETQKKKEAELAKIRAEHEEQDRIEAIYSEQGYEGLELTQKVMRHQEVERLEKSGELIEKAPTSMTLSSESLVKGGKGPFQSKVGDLHLVTPEQYASLPENTRLFNFRTGEDFIIGVDDAKDASTFARKIGGKFTEWGFKVQP